MARDLKLLEEKYSIKSVTPVDMFPHTASVECVSVLINKNNWKITSINKTNKPNDEYVYPLDESYIPTAGIL